MNREHADKKILTRSARILGKHKMDISAHYLTIEVDTLTRPAHLILEFLRNCSRNRGRRPSHSEEFDPGGSSRIKLFGLDGLPGM